MDSISNINGLSFMPQALEKPKPQGAFDSFLNAASEAFSETNALEQEANRAQLDLASGKTDDMLAVVIAQEMAYSSLSFTVQAVNKVIESYKEVMRMQV
jgi:flagellar hook-basal body complex protein FliE